MQVPFPLLWLPRIQDIMDTLQAHAVSGMLFAGMNDDNTPDLFSME